MMKQSASERRTVFNGIYMVISCEENALCVGEKTEIPGATRVAEYVVRFYRLF